ncbi:alpha/beta hydrolase [Pseudomonas tohonis]|uniref:alpha/beta hydrolase n=1 Tax=Pseudomonas tohonis TaxID=2725477 RepID=UPI0021DB2089|nr:lysophospholipase [Pseudomonas tohonis]UXY53757.1 lysophospholipase [Pseudomonas tohonis]
MPRALLWTTLLAVLLYLALCAALFVFQRALLYFPQPRAVQAPESTLELPVAEGRLVVTVRPRPGADALLYFGGNAEDVSMNLEQLAGAFPDHALYLMHYPGYGGSSGEPGEALILDDAQRLFDHIHPEHPRVAVVGRSLGSGVAVQLASQRPVSRLVLITPYDSIENVAAGRFPWAPVRWLLKDRYRSADVAGALRVPTLLMLAGDDQVIPRASSDRLAASFAPGVARLEVLAGAGHNDISLHPRYLALLGEALR